MKLSIIIPTQNEAAALRQTLPSIADNAHEIIVVDGGSRDKTAEVAGQYTPHVLVSARGRGIQQHTGACHARGNVFLFLHADTFLPKGFELMIQETLSVPRVVFGAFLLSISPSSAALHLIAVMVNLRSRLLKMPYGDQALFLRRSDYFRVGGFKNLPILEDVELVRKLNRIGRFRLTRGSVKTSARRWKKEGILYTTLRNWSLIIRYLLGESPHNLHHLYPDIAKVEDAEDPRRQG